MQSREIDPLLEPLLLPARDEEVDLFLSQLIATHAEPVISGIIRHKLHLLFAISSSLRLGQWLPPASRVPLHSTPGSNL